MWHKSKASAAFNEDQHGHPSTTIEPLVGFSGLVLDKDPSNAKTYASYEMRFSIVTPDGIPVGRIEEQKLTTYQRMFSTFNRAFTLYVFDCQRRLALIIQQPSKLNSSILVYEYMPESQAAYQVVGMIQRRLSFAKDKYELFVAREDRRDQMDSLGIMKAPYMTCDFSFDKPGKRANVSVCRGRRECVEANRSSFMQLAAHEDRYCALLLTARIALSFGRLCGKADPNRSDGTTMAERAMLLGLGIFVECKFSANSRISEIYGEAAA